MGDLIMSGPAIRALKESFDARITVLTSSMAVGIAKNMPEIDDVIIFDVPWIKTKLVHKTYVFNEIIEEVKGRKFDAAVIFTVYSQNPLPSAMIAYMAGIPKRLAYCRENPYQLLTEWVPDKEPYSIIKHQVWRDLSLVATVGAFTKNESLFLQQNYELWAVVEQKLGRIGVDIGKKWMILHAGVSEEKRQFALEKWVSTGKKIIDELGYQLILTGSVTEKALTDQLENAIGTGSFSAGGLFNIDEFVLLIGKAPIVLSVNTATAHIAAAVGTAVVVLYALTNPQHTPWRSVCKVLPFDVPEAAQSKNEVIRFVNDKLFNKPVEMPTEDNIIDAMKELITFGTHVSTSVKPGVIS
ncbi:glycosyltransferase family 9 protein [Mucilaginibacter pocheonensis]|uniref:ADP-heptose:LPS heptosyltransferase n=1 Tax=Mucilaginibacter pocheonensis TaxID=398050 RepID=A0ABU1TCQ7_9SPHI|nr:glycosyltransferase family 9 protein [Mucilaginibacter pocheonensis]MDR6943182.1 ADP-heptose:LPS heptosyltransferase [Mucilaginibacter pocheonensis]